MKILVTGAKGFVGRNLCENLKAVRDGKNRTRPAWTTFARKPILCSI